MYIGKFGNSNPNYVQDWVKFDPAADSSKMKGPGKKWYSDQGKCEFPTSYQIHVYYQKIGSLDNFQNIIVKA